MKAVLFPNFQKDNALSCARRVCDVLTDEDIQVCVSEEYRGEFADKPSVRFEPMDEASRNADLVIAIGGDGTILRCAKYLMGSDTKLLGINTGTLGFMAGLEADQLDRLKKLRTGNYNISERMTLGITVHSTDGEMNFTALNDVCVKSKNSRICDFDVLADGYLIGRYRADGVLFSSPSGSTAYALSAGGPIIEPELECVEMTLICPHSLFARATMFSADRTLKCVNTTDDDERPMGVSIDGEKNIELPYGSSVEIYRGASKIRFIDLIGNSFHESLCKKMMKPVK
ncbi:MAG: NAD(+)/NADH kinase [Oscillospiraceae bacterium]|nr:NAD(+)/NADH kinase [Oscillospiraceae bacterium]